MRSVSLDTITETAAKHGFGIEYGRATGGIIQIHTRPSRSQEVTGFAELSFINLAAYLEGPIWKEKNISFSAAVRRSAIDFVLPAVIPEDANIDFLTAPTYYDGQLRVDWLPNPNDRVSFLFATSFDQLSLDAAINAAPARQTALSSEVRRAIYRSYLEDARKQAASLADPCDHSCVLEGDLGELQFFALDQRSTAEPVS